MRRLAGARVFHPTAAHMRPLHEDVARACVRLVGAQRILIFWPFLYSFGPFSVLWSFNLVP
jgi:hypothetical protein